MKVWPNQSKTGILAILLERTRKKHPWKYDQTKTNQALWSYYFEELS